MQNKFSAPTPDLRIVRIDSVHAHEQHDDQRSIPLMEKLRGADVFTNPPIVAPMGVSQFVILDGANRCYTFGKLGYPHILVQVTSYDSGYVDLKTWRHVLSDWQREPFIAAIKQLNDVQIIDKQHRDAICHIAFKDGDVIALHAPVQTTHERNEVLREVVAVYQQNATLYRTAINEPNEVWGLYEDAFAYVMFPEYRPADIIAAAKYQAYLPPGISRHIIHGRALLVNYPMDLLRDPRVKLVEKNQALNDWIREKLSNRQVRYYAETTYQFDE
jgi:hypothetical protein